ncbi:MAG: hypothetical protein IKV00_05875, partial [Clostridia bacterium]|nr:hypothetical protein [Clostridia bacterium]
GIVGANSVRPFVGFSPHVAGDQWSPLRVLGLPFRICEPTDKSKFDYNEGIIHASLFIPCRRFGIDFFICNDFVKKLDKMREM